MDHHQQVDGSYKWMWTTTPTKRKLEFSPYDSWEEQAFAEDAAGLLGSSGCVWPPRSYTCTFCRREFRSAQALGGHMNVHRRDRARLKQLPNTPQDHQTLVTPFKVAPSYKKCPSTTFVHNTNPNPNNPLSSADYNYHHKSHDDLPNYHPNYGKRDAKIIEVECREDSNKFAKSELSISLNLVVRTNHSEEEPSCLKRRKIVTSSPDESRPLIFESEASEVDHKIKKVHGLANYSSSSREIDLELRLGV